MGEGALNGPVEVFYSYAPRDAAMREELERYLSTLRRQGRIVEWHVGKLEVGGERARAVEEHLNRAALILLLISANFVDSNECYYVELPRAMQRQAAGEAW